MTASVATCLDAGGVRRRLTPVRRALLTVITLLPDLFTGDARLGAVRLALATPSALVALRSHAAAHLSTLPTPLGSIMAGGSGRDEGLESAFHPWRTHAAAIRGHDQSAELQRSKQTDWILPHAASIELRISPAAEEVEETTPATRAQA